MTKKYYSGPSALRLLDEYLSEVRERTGLELSIFWASNVMNSLCEYYEGATKNPKSQRALTEQFNGKRLADPCAHFDFFECVPQWAAENGVGAEMIARYEADVLPRIRQVFLNELAERESSKKFRPWLRAGRGQEGFTTLGTMLWIAIIAAIALVLLPRLHILPPGRLPAHVGEIASQRVQVREHDRFGMRSPLCAVAQNRCDGGL